MGFGSRLRDRCSRGEVYTIITDRSKLRESWSVDMPFLSYVLCPPLYYTPFSLLMTMYFPIALTSKLAKQSKPKKTIHVPLSPTIPSDLLVEEPTSPLSQSLFPSPSPSSPQPPKRDPVLKHTSYLLLLRPPPPPSLPPPSPSPPYPNLHNPNNGPTTITTTPIYASITSAKTTLSLPPTPP